MMSIERSGVLTWTAPSVSSQWSSTSRSVASMVGGPVAPDQARAASRRRPPGRAGRRPRRAPRRRARSSVCSAAQGSSPAPTPPDSRCPRSRAAGWSSAPLRPRNSVRSAVHAVWRPPRSANATRPPKSVFQALRASSAPVSGVDLGDETGRWRCARRPAPTRRRRSPRDAAAGRTVLDRQPRDLDGSSSGTNWSSSSAMPSCDVLEAAVALAVPGDVGRLLRGSAARRAPQLAGLLVPDVDRLARRVADRVVRPRRELVLAAVDRPRVARPRTRRPGSRTRVRDDVDPGRRRPLPLAEDGDVLPPVLGEAAEAVEELELRARRGRLACRGGCSAPAGARLRGAAARSGPLERG